MVMPRDFEHDEECAKSGDNAVLAGGTTDTVPRGYSYGAELQQVKHAVPMSLNWAAAGLLPDP